MYKFEQIMNLLIGEKFVKVFIITDDMLKGFSTITGDLNPIHLDEDFAQNTIYKRRIAPGMLIGSLISTVLGNDFPGIGTIYLTQTLKFLFPVFIGDNISVHVEVIEIKKNNWISLKTDCFNQDKKLVLVGEAVIQPPDQREHIV